MLKNQMFMKKKKSLARFGFAAFLMLTVLGESAAQNPDTTFVSVGQESGVLEKQRFMDRYDYVFGTQQRTRLLLKLAAPTGLGAELKLSPAFSLNASYAPAVGYQPVSAFGSGEVAYSHNVRGELRWYHHMKRRMARGLSANNMSGDYLSVEYGQVSPQSYGEGSLVRNLANQRTLALRVGLQRRLFRYAFFDFSYGLGVKQYHGAVLRDQPWKLFANPRATLGLALASPNKKTNAGGGFCDVLRCFREERSMWKIDLYHLFRMEDKDNLSGRLSIAYERKIGASPFSLEVEANAAASKKEVFESLANGYDYYLLGEWSTSLGGQLRYYYDLRQRVARGKSGNNLSGPYLAAMARGDWYANEYVSRASEDNRRTVTAGLLWGLQYRLFKNGFVDFNFGVGQSFSNENGLENGQSYDRQNTELSFLANFRAGFAF
jgi:hypothetical protein